jgi:hypothetical protein
LGTIVLPRKNTAESRDFLARDGKFDLS